MVAAPIVHTKADKLNDRKIDVNDGLIAVGDISQQPPHAPLVVNNIDDDNNAAGSGDDDDDEDVNDNEDDDKSVAATDALKGNQSDSDNGKQRLQCRGKDNTKKNADYSQLMAARRARREGYCWTLICDGCVFFLSYNLSDAKPIPEEDREEFALGVTLVHYSMITGIRQFKAKGEAGVTKELTQMHDMNVFCPIEVKSLTYNKKKKALLSLMFLKEKRDSLVKARMCADGRKKKDGT